MDEVKAKEVYYNQYCFKCIHAAEPESSDKCNECLNEACRLYTHKPLNYQEKD